MDETKKTGGPLWLTVPHDGTDKNKQSAFPNPDADGADEAFELVVSLMRRFPAEEKAALRRVYEYADAYMNLTTCDSGQESRVNRLREIWRARRAQNGGAT
jgi:hypothetical protein